MCEIVTAIADAGDPPEADAGRLDGGLGGGVDGGLDDDDGGGVQRPKAVRAFDGFDDEVRFPAVELNGAFTLAVLHKRRSTGGWQSLLANHTAGGDAAVWMEFDPTNAIGVGVTGTFTTGPTLTSTSTWYLIVASKAAGTATPRFHVYDFGTSTWTHEDATLELTNAPAHGGGTLRMGQWQDTDPLHGRIAVAAVWTAGMTDIEAKALVSTLDTEDWRSHALPPAWLVEPGQQVAPVEDLVGENDSISIDGTTLVDDDDGPPGWSYLGSDG